MAQLQVPESPKEFATHYQMLLGVDYQADQTQVDRKRSPDMVNMISDFGGNPVKRDGYRKVGIGYSSLLMVEGKMYGVYAGDGAFSIAELELDGYELNEIATYPKLWTVGEVNGVFAYQRVIYVLADNALISFDVETHDFGITGVGANMMSDGAAVGQYKPMKEDIVPNTIINLKPDGTDGATLDDKNLMSIYQMFSYKGDNSSATYKIPNYTKMGTWVKVEVMDSNGDWTTLTAGTHYNIGTATTEKGKKLDGTDFEDNSVVDAEVVFTAGNIPDVTPLTGKDNVRITFAPFSVEVLEAGTPNKYKGYYNETFAELLKSKASTFQANRMFVSDKYKVYYSEVAKPFMVSDLAWFDVDSEVIGFTRTNNYLVVLTKDNGRTTIYLASEATRTVDSQTGETETYFAVKESNAGIGAIAPKCISTLSDEPMFLSSTGLYGILSNYLSEKYAVNRSSRINRKLCKEQNLENAVGLAFNDYFYLAINGRMYVLDGRHKESDRAGNKPLEAYYFEGLPAIENMYVIGNKMYFSAEDGTYTWNDDLPETERYYDDAYTKEVTTVEWQISNKRSEPPTGEWVNVKPTPQAGEYLWYKATYDDLSEEITLEELDVGDKRLAGEPVCARWCSTFDDDGSPQKLKTLMKKGSMITLVPHYKSGCEITLVKDGDVFEYLGSFDSSLQTFEYIDFTQFTFNANAVAMDIFTKKKIKKYKRLQIQVENNNPEPFGITQITKTYTFGNYAKR
jgi:hypothetical protein